MKSSISLVMPGRVWFAFVTACAPALFAATDDDGSSTEALPQPTTANPGLHYYYPVPELDPPDEIETDICVYGGTPGGVAAAVQASRMGKNVTLAVFRRHVGGVTSGGLTDVDIGNAKSVGGIAREYFSREGGNPWSTRDAGQHNWNSGLTPNSAETGFRTLLAEAGVPVYFEHRLAGVTKEGDRITSISFENGRKIRARAYIDATYEGDLLAMAGVTYTVGRESNAQYGERHNGYRISQRHQFEFPVDPYHTPGDPTSGLLPGIEPGAPQATGSEDRRVQAYNFRMWLTNKGGGSDFTEPEGYDPAQYALLGRYLNAAPDDFDWGFRYRYGPIRMINGDCNAAGPFTTDLVGGNYNWPEADYPTREKLFQDHVRYQKGLVWYLISHEDVPAKVSRFMRRFQLPTDQFTETGGWPHELYVREGRRMVSDYVMTDRDCLGKRKATDSVGLASYNMDSHNTSRVVVDGVVKAEGTVIAKIPVPYPISYRSLVPKTNECTNLLVSGCISSSHIAFGSIRMEPVFMILGQSAATAAAIAIDMGTAVQKVPYPELRERLLADKQILEYTETSEKEGGS